jgi:hypothetical protein
MTATRGLSPLFGAEFVQYNFKQKRMRTIAQSDQDEVPLKKFGCFAKLV